MKSVPRVYPILDTPTLERRGCGVSGGLTCGLTCGLTWTMAAQAMLDGGAEILQFRHKSHWTPEVFAQAEQIAAACKQAAATFIVNDRADMAKLLGAGLHIGQQDMTPGDCRRVIGNEPTLGYSTHNAAQLHAAAEEPVDYLAFGPIFPTVSKENPDPVCGLDTLSKGLKKPLVAIGGITLQNAAAVYEAGADSIALIGNLLPDVLTESTIRGRMEEWQRLTRQ